MEMTVRYAKNADADVDASYLRNLPLIKLLQQEPVNTEDWDVLLSATPNGEDKLLWCLSYVGALCALDATDFDNWFMQQIWHHILNGLCTVLQQDTKIRPDAFNAQFTVEKFADVLFSLMLSALLRQDYDPAAVLEIVRRTLY